MKTAFLFAPLGMQDSVTMSCEKEVQAALKECHACYEEVAGDKLAFSAFCESTFCQHDSARPQQVVWMFVRQYAVLKCLEARRITPDFVLGHSNGEFAAAVAAGSLDLPNAMQMLVARAKALQTTADGSMASVKASEAEVTSVLESLDLPVVVAAINSPEDTVVSGPTWAVNSFCLDSGLQAKRLDVPAAMHSDMVASSMRAVCEVAKTCNLRAPQRCGMVSSLTGTQVSHEASEWAHWSGQDEARPMQFLEGMRCLRRLGCSHFVEVGNAGKLLAVARRCVGDEAGLTWSTAQEALGPAREQSQPAQWLDPKDHESKAVFILHTMISSIAIEGVPAVEAMQTSSATLRNLGLDSRAIEELSNKLKREGLNCGMTFGCTRVSRASCWTYLA